MPDFSTEDVVRRASQAAFGKPLVANMLRGHLVEAMISLALSPDWAWCGGDYAGWDFENACGVRLEIKQSAVRQSWAPPAKGAAAPRFDIRPRTGFWRDGAVWVEQPGRLAHGYVFAWHGEQTHTADHRDPVQWRFFVVATVRLPDQLSIGLPAVRRLAEPVCLADLSRAIRALALAPLPERQ